MASSDLKGEVLASTRKSRGVLAESSVKRQTVRETGGVSDRVHTSKAPQRRHPKTGVGGIRQGRPHRESLTAYNAELAQRPCLSGGELYAQ